MSTHASARALAALACLLIGADVALAQNPPAQPPVQPAAQPGGRGGGGGGRGPIRVMSLTSPAFTDGGVIPLKHAQAGHDVSPPLAWSGVPDSTRSFVLIMHDADAALGDGTDDLLHWMVWNIPATSTSLEEGIKQGLETPVLRQISATGPNYRGPAAPATGPAHHYVFELYALDVTVNVPAVGQSAIATRAALLDVMRTHIRGKGVLVGLYKRPAP